MKDNFVYNHNFQSPPNSPGRWPPGWEAIGGNGDSSWRRVAQDSSDGRYCMVISNPTHDGRCGIREVPPVTTPISPGETWRVEARIRLDNAGKVYVALHFYGESGNVVKELREEFTASSHMQVCGYDYSIPPLAVQSAVEIGVEEPNTLWIDWVAKARKESTREQVVQERDTDRCVCRAGRMLLGRLVDQCYVALIDKSDTSNPGIHLGRCLVSLEGRKKEEIVFRPGSSSVQFGQVYLNSTGRTIIELSVGTDEAKNKLDILGGELGFLLSSPIHLLNNNTPLNIKIINPGPEPLSYCLVLGGELLVTEPRE